MAITHTRPEWGDSKVVNQHFGISRSVLYRLFAEGKIKSTSLRERGKLRGKRLFSLDSVAALLESRAVGGDAMD
jgi:predicted site-specific integrase-resolvase